MNQVATAPIKTIKQHLQSEEMEDRLRQLLPKHMDAERMARIAILAITRTPKLAECDQASFFQSLLNLSAWGLEPDGRRAHLIPFENRKRGVVECQLIIDYKGLVELALRSGQISNIHADIVCDKDDFEYDRGKITRHKIDFRLPRGEIYAAYCIVKMKDGSEKCEVMSREEIDKIRGRSKASNNGPWKSDYAEMAKKTAFRRVSKWIPLSPEFRDAVKTDDEQFDHPPAIDVAPIQVESQSPLDQLTDRLEAESTPVEVLDAEPEPEPQSEPESPAAMDVQELMDALTGELESARTAAELESIRNKYLELAKSVNGVNLQEIKDAALVQLKELNG